MGETKRWVGRRSRCRPFSILKRIVMGETLGVALRAWLMFAAFSILKRIVMGETSAVSLAEDGTAHFQYPQADRDG